MYKRKNGIYYTPVEFSNLIIKYLQQSKIDYDYKDVLEPSCGDCRFIKAVNEYLNISGKIVGVEKDKRAFLKLKNDSELNQKKIKLLHQDFFDFAKVNKKKYSLISGNPPYVDYKNFTVKTKSLLEKNEKHYNRYGKIKNLWQLFFVECLDMLSPSGVMCMVLPSEMLQVSYAKPLRDQSLKAFKYVEILTLGDGLFPELQQSVVVFIGYKEHELEGVAFKKMSTDTKNLNLPIITETSFVKKNILTDKWIHNRIKQSEYRLVNKIAVSVTGIVSDYCSTSTGIVTGANEFFLRNKEEIGQDLSLKYHLPILQKGEFVKSCLDFKKSDFSNNVDAGAKCYLLALSDEKSASSLIRGQLRLAEKVGISQRFKCNERKPWYSVGGLEIGEGYFFKRSHRHPKIVKNSSKVFATDTAYKIKMKKGYNIESLIFSFYNSFTLIQSELSGRVYGGGVLELTPSEFQSLRVPYYDITKKEFQKLDVMLRKNNDLNQIIDYVDNVIFKNMLKIEKNDILKIQALRKSLVLQRT